jgi:hypothetical protein
VKIKDDFVVWRISGQKSQANQPPQNRDFGTYKTGKILLNAFSEPTLL